MNIRNASVSTADPSKGERIQLTTLQVASKVVAGSPGAKLRGATGLPGEGGEHDR
jgi:hypothetical protein